MPVVSEYKDVDALTLTFVAEFGVPVEQVYRLWEDPRMLERWWGPPAYPATFDRHEFAVGGRSDYYMTTPEGEKPAGWWEFTAIDPPRRLEFDYGLSDADRNPVAGMGAAHGMVTLEPADGKTRMTIVSTFPDVEQFEKMMEMGMQDGMREALGQIDGILAQVRA